MQVVPPRFCDGDQVVAVIDPDGLFSSMAEGEGISKSDQMKGRK